MNRNLGVGVLILCFVLSSARASLATQVLDVPPGIVQPFDLGAINLQMIEMDRENQEQEQQTAAIRSSNRTFSILTGHLFGVL